jgi:hypothetical protein
MNVLIFLIPYRDLLRLPAVHPDLNAVAGRTRGDCESDLRRLRHEVEWRRELGIRAVASVFPRAASTSLIVTHPYEAVHGHPDVVTPDAKVEVIPRVYFPPDTPTPSLLAHARRAGCNSRPPLSAGSVTPRSSRDRRPASGSRGR